MVNLLTILLCLCIGWFLIYHSIVSSDAYKHINKILIWVCIPAISLKNLSNFQFQPNTLTPVITAWVIFIGAIVFFNIFKNSFNLSNKSMGSLILTAGIGSISFVGFPIFELYYGKVGLAIGVIMSQLGTIMVAMTLGIAVANYYSDDKKSIAQQILSFVKFPPFVATALALFINFFKINLSNDIYNLLSVFANPFTFLALISVGMQLQFQSFTLNKKELLLGLGYKLVICPLLAILFFLQFKKTTEINISILGSALGSMNTAAIIADDFNLNSDLASKMVAYSIPISIITTLIIQYLL